ncbi:hypothetical protein D3C72_679680 [compost metagenome]
MLGGPGLEPLERGQQTRLVVRLDHEEALGHGAERPATLGVAVGVGGFAGGEHGKGGVAVHAEGGDARPARAVRPVAQPVLGAARGVEAAFERGELALRAHQGRHRGQDFLVERQRGLDDRREAGGGAGVADGGLDGAEGARSALALGEGGRERLGLGHVLGGVAAAVGLEVPDAIRGDVRLGQGAAERAVVGGGVGLAGGACGGRAEALDHGVDAIARRQRVVQALEHQRRGAFAHHGAGGVGLEGPGLRAVGAVGMGGPHGADVAREVDRADERLVQLAALKRAHAGLEGAQARGLFGGDGEGGAAHAELAGDAARDHAAQGARGAVGREGRAQSAAQGVGPLRQLGV